MLSIMKLKIEKTFGIVYCFSRIKETNFMKSLTSLTNIKILVNIHQSTPIALFSNNFK